MRTSKCLCLRPDSNQLARVCKTWDLLREGRGFGSYRRTWWMLMTLELCVSIKVSNAILGGDTPGPNCSSHDCITEVFPHQQPRDPKSFPGGALFPHTSHLSINSFSVCECVCACAQACLSACLSLSVSPTCVCACMCALHVWGGAYAHVCSYTERLGGQSWGCLARWLAPCFFETESLIKSQAR